MKQLKKSLAVPTIIVCTLGWGYFASQAIDNKEGTTESNNVIRSLEDIKKNSIAYQHEQSYKNIQVEYERLKEEERKRLEELERQRLERLEKIRLEKERLAKIEEAKKLAEQKRIAEQKKQQQQVISRGNDTVGSWRTFEATYYSAFCDTCGGKGLTASGISVANSIYYKGMRVIATNKNEIPMYSIVEVKAPYGNFKAIALDTGGFGAGGVDILVDSDKTAYSLGRHNVQIRILKYPNK